MSDLDRANSALLAQQLLIQTLEQELKQINDRYQKLLTNFEICDFCHLIVDNVKEWAFRAHCKKCNVMHSYCNQNCFHSGYCLQWKLCKPHSIDE